MWFLFVSYFEKMERKKETEGNRKGKDDTGMRKPETEVDDDVEPWYEYMGSPVGQGLVLVEGMEVVAGIFTVPRSS